MYVVTKEECERNIKGVCEGCGGPLTAMKTLDNSGNPTHWQGCEHCSCFRAGADPRHVKIARRLVGERRIIPYSFMNRKDYEKDPDKLEFYLSVQTAGLSGTIAYIEQLLKEIQ